MTPEPVEETTPPEPVDEEDWSDDEEDEDPPGTIPVFNFLWLGRYNDGFSTLSFTSPYEKDMQAYERVNVKPGQFLLIAWCYENDATYALIASLTVLDEEPDLGDKEKYPDENWKGTFKYEVKSHEALQSEIL